MFLDELKKANWWELQKEDDGTERLQWSSIYDGIVRVKLDSIADWSYNGCPKISYAKLIGLVLIKAQKKEREREEYDCNYQGA